MITPNKFISLDNSILAKLSVILESCEEEIGVRELYREIADEFDIAHDFLLAIDVLYILGVIEVDLKTGMVSRVD